jgi:hypothetical protein
MTAQPLRAADALKYAAATLKHQADWIIDSIGCNSGCDHEAELDTLDDTIKEICELAARFGDPRTYSDGRTVVSAAQIERGAFTSHIWNPDFTVEQPRSWSGPLSSGHPDLPSPGVYQVSTDPLTQEIHVQTVRLTPACDDGPTDYDEDDES